jgi:hypothetical protein
MRYFCRNNPQVCSCPAGPGLKRRRAKQACILVPPTFGKLYKIAHFLNCFESVTSLTLSASVQTASGTLLLCALVDFVEDDVLWSSDSSQEECAAIGTLCRGSLARGVLVPRGFDCGRRCNTAEIMVLSFPSFSQFPSYFSDAGTTYSLPLKASLHGRRQNGHHRCRGRCNCVTLHACDVPWFGAHVVLLGYLAYTTLYGSLMG